MQLVTIDLLNQTLSGKTIVLASGVKENTVTLELEEAV